MSLFVKLVECACEERGRVTCNGELLQGVDARDEACSMKSVLELGRGGGGIATQGEGCAAKRHKSDAATGDALACTQ